MRKYPSGAKRSTEADRYRFDLIPQHGLRRIAETCRHGAEKYGDRNWEAGFPATVMLNHALNHLNLYLAGDSTEDHLAHAAWNLMALMDFETIKPEMIDIPVRQPSNSQESS